MKNRKYINILLIATCISLASSSFGCSSKQKETTSRSKEKVTEQTEEITSTSSEETVSETSIESTTSSSIETTSTPKLLDAVKTHTVGKVSYMVQNEWKYKENGKFQYCYVDANDSDTFLMISANQLDQSFIPIDRQSFEELFVGGYISGMTDDPDWKDVVFSTPQIRSVGADLCADFSASGDTMGCERDYLFYLYQDNSSGIFYSFSMTMKSATSEERKEENKRIYDFTIASITSLDAGEKNVDGTTSESTVEQPQENTYEHNEYYDVVQEGKYKNSIGTVYIVHKVLAKKDVSLSASAIAYDSNGDVIGKSTDEICLTAGQTNYFEFHFDEDVSSENIEIKVNVEKDSWPAGPRNAVKLVKWNQKGDNLYITVEQTDKLGVFAQIKVIMYKKGEIVKTESGYIDVYAEGLNGIGSTDVIDFWMYKVKFDDIELIYEP